MPSSKINFIYQVELLLLRSVVERAWITDLDSLSHTFTGLDCTAWKNKKQDRTTDRQYRVRVRAWNEFENAASAAGPYTYTPFRKTRTCTMPTAPSDVAVGGLHHAAVRVSWTPPTDVANLGYYSIRYRPNYSRPGADVSCTHRVKNEARSFSILALKRHRHLYFFRTTNQLINQSINQSIESRMSGRRRGPRPRTARRSCTRTGTRRSVA